MENNSCVFCKFAGDTSVKVWENKLFFTMFDSFPVNPGHALIIPKRHVVSLADLNDKEWHDLYTVNTAIKGIIEKSDFRKIYAEMLQKASSDNSIKFLKDALENPRINTKPDAYNYGINDGKTAGRTVDHLHWHIIPRYNGDVEDPTGGVRLVIPEKGNYKK